MLVDRSPRSTWTGLWHSDRRAVRRLRECRPILLTTQHDGGHLGVQVGRQQHAASISRRLKAAAAAARRVRRTSEGYIGIKRGNVDLVGRHHLWRNKLSEFGDSLQQGHSLYLQCPNV